MQDKCILKDSIVDFIYIVIDEHNNLNPNELTLEKSLETVLLGPQGNLDSLGLITLLVEIESSMKENIDLNINIIDEIYFADENGPYQNIKTLSEYIFKQIK